MIEQKDSEILELAGFADRNRKAKEVHSEPIFIQVNSKLAAYTIAFLQVRSAPSFSRIRRWRRNPS